MLLDLVFNPADITVRVGDTIEWANADFIDHTATAISPPERELGCRLFEQARSPTLLPLSSRNDGNNRRR
jgi:plastocyanin